MIRCYQIVQPPRILHGSIFCEKAAGACGRCMSVATNRMRGAERGGMACLAYVAFLWVVRLPGALPRRYSATANPSAVDSAGSVRAFDEHANITASRTSKEISGDN